MALSVTKRASGGYTIVSGGVTSYWSNLHYKGYTNGVDISNNELFTSWKVENVLPADWTVDGATGFTTVLQVCNALDAIGVSGNVSTGVNETVYRTFSKTVTRPANTTVYTAADVIGDVSAALDSIADVAKVAGYGVCITNVRIQTTDTGLSGKTIRVHFLNDTDTAIADNAAFAIGTSSKRRGYVDVVMGTGNLAKEGQANAENLVVNPVTRAINFILETTEGFTPSGNSTTLRVEIGCILSV